MLEVIATSVEDAVMAERAGADRLELCTSLSEQGLTPSLGLIELVVDAVRIPVHVIIRPHNRGFHYSKYDVSVMQKDIQHVKKLGVAGVVLGALTKNGDIDVETLRFLCQEAAGLAITFHRAFDEVSNQFEALDILATFPEINQVLTAGGQLPAPKSAVQLKKLIDCQKVGILVGYGLTVDALPKLLAETGAENVHFGSGVRVNQSFSEPIDPQKIIAVKNILKEN